MDGQEQEQHPNQPNQHLQQQQQRHDSSTSMDVESINNNVSMDGKDLVVPAVTQSQPQTNDDEAQPAINNNVDDGSASNLNFKIDKCIENLRGIDFDCINELCAHFEWTPNEQKLLTIVQEKVGRIKELEGRLRQKENEIAELRSHLDKFQSVFPFSRARQAGVNGNMGQRQRAQGISAEPQNETSVLEMLHVTFPKYQKDAKYVNLIKFLTFLYFISQSFYIDPVNLLKVQFWTMIS